MKKTILALFLLLFLLILTCVYTKTSMLYTKYNQHTTAVLVTSATSLHPSTEKIKQESSINKIRKEAIKESIIRATKKPVVTPAEKEKVKLSNEDNDIKEIDTLLRALKEREVTFKNRDAFEYRLKQLIQKALKNRSLVIANMNKEALYLIELQKELLKERDTSYHKIGQTNTPTLGE